EERKCGASTAGSPSPGCWHCSSVALAGATHKKSLRRGEPCVQSEQGDAVRQLQIRARTNEDADCLMRELAAYSPTRSRRALTVELDERPETVVLGLLAAVE